MAAAADEPLPHRWLYPSAVPQGPDDAPTVLTDAQVDEYHRTGCCVLDGLWPVALVARVKADAERIFRGGGEQTAAHSGLNSNLMSFPSNESDALNELTLHPRLLTAMSELLRVPPTELRLAQSELWEKSAANNNHGNSDQRTHMGKRNAPLCVFCRSLTKLPCGADFINHTLLVPPPQPELESVVMIAYWDDIEDCDGPTHVVPQEGPDDPAYAWPGVARRGRGDGGEGREGTTLTPAFSGWGRHPYAHDPPYLAYSGEGGYEEREPAESWLAEHHPALGAFRQMLYERERAVHFRVGTVLLYRHDTWYVCCAAAAAAG